MSRTSSVTIVLVLVSFVAPLAFGLANANDALVEGQRPPAAYRPPPGETLTPGEAPAGLGTIDPWIDAQGDQMFGDLALDLNALTFAGGDLSAAADGELIFGANRVCIQNVVCDATVRRVESGAGLTGGPITTEGTLSIAASGVIETMLAFDPATQAELEAYSPDWADLANVPAGFADGEDDVGGAAPPRPGFSRTVLDDRARPTTGTSMVIGADGLPLITYSDNDLRAAHCDDIACRRATTAIVDSGGETGYYSSVAIGSDDLPLISYLDRTNGDLKVAHCADVACTSATRSTLETTCRIGYYTSITIGSDGLGLITYSSDCNTGLRVAHCADVACTSATLSTISTGWYSSVTIGSDGLGLVSFLSSAGLRVAHCLDVACASSTVSVVDAAGSGESTSVTIGADGLGLIAYERSGDDGIGVAHCTTLSCSSATLTTLDTQGSDASVTIGSDGLGLIAYRQYLPNNDLKLAHCSDIYCNSATLAIIDSVGDVGYETSITIGTDGFGLISYVTFDDDGDPDDLKVAHMSNRLGVPFHRAR